MKESQKYAIHLDNLRIKNKLTIDDFCEDIVDIRTFHRYKSGQRSLKHPKISAFCKKLKISTVDFYYSASKQDVYEFQRINNLYSLIINRNYQLFYEQSSTLKLNSIVEEQNKRFLGFCYCKADYETNSTPLQEILLKLYKLCNYPNCLAFFAFDFVSLISLQLIAEIEIKTNKVLALNKLINILYDIEVTYTSSETSKILPSIFSNTSLFLLRLHKHKEAKHISSIGIEYSIKHSDFSGLAHLYYVQSYSNLILGNRLDAEKYANLCIITSIAKKNDYEINMFINTIKKDLEMSPIQLYNKCIEDINRDIK
ncbi:hypothetical protein BK011_07845 [Tenericutes bacterium MZ-XQ]|nr:hypothetical protein BK011_07845 [Tenericutes bacterium MZ-XQ]